jgi:hypothetical protein
MRFLGYLKMWERSDGQTQCGKLYQCDEVVHIGRPIILELAAILSFVSNVCFC